MPRQFTLFTGQWADLPLEEVCRLARDFGYDGLELACWGDHFEVDKALADPAYIDSRKQLLDEYGLKCWAVSNHLTGQAVCDAIIDERHQAILPGHQHQPGKTGIVEEKDRAKGEIPDRERVCSQPRIEGEFETHRRRLGEPPRECIRLLHAATVFRRRLRPRSGPEAWRPDRSGNLRSPCETPI